MFKNKTILITGGTGSFGRHLTKKLLSNYSLKKIIIFSRDEFKQYQFKNSIDKKFHKKIRFFLGDIRDYERLKFALSDVDVVFHAAALKHVPALEYNPFEAVKTNIIGSENLINACLNSHKIKKIIALSTDKATAPINLYGATKLAAEKLFVAANNFSGKGKSIFSVVRYGNVMSSRGSVIPHFMSQKNQGYMTITHPKMTRFNITLDEGVNFVINSFSKMLGGEIFIPKLPSYKILDLAKAVCGNTKIRFTGIRQGEKLNEEMISVSESINSIDCGKYFIILSPGEYTNKYRIKKIIKKNKGKIIKESFSYNSLENKNFLTITQLKKLIY